jgi:tripartite ATP-independent transporter DctM subunit
MAMVNQQILDIGMGYGLSVLPLFILMGVFVGRSGLADDLYECCNRWMGHFRGGLAMATIVSCGGFAAVSGSSLATVATMAKVAIPPMRKFRYADSFAAGTVAAGGTLGMLIPPSTALIVYGILTETDIAQLFAGAILPGLRTASCQSCSARRCTRQGPIPREPGGLLVIPGRREMRERDGVAAVEPVRRLSQQALCAPASPRRSAAVASSTSTVSSVPSTGSAGAAHRLTSCRRTEGPCSPFHLPRRASSPR